MQVQFIVDTLTRHVEMRGFPPVDVSISLPPHDDEADRATEVLGYAEGQSFIIEYLDSARRASTRRITVFQIVQGRAGIPSLMARCHERKATRQFRVDRIRACVDFDGEVHDDVPRFLFDNFGMSLGLSSRSAVNDTAARWPDIRDFIKPDAVILAALSHADGHVHALEKQGIEQHLTFIAERDGWLLSEPEISAIGKLVERLRPTPQAIESALDAISKRSPDSIVRLLRTAKEVVDADGRRHPEEIAMLDDISVELTGIQISA